LRNRRCGYGRAGSAEASSFQELTTFHVNGSPLGFITVSLIADMMDLDHSCPVINLNRTVVDLDTE
jgi:hypothetical protein